MTSNHIRGQRPGLASLAARLGAAALAVASLGSLASCTEGRDFPDILLVTIDTLRADHTSAYGYAVPTTPFLAHLAEDGALFERAYAPTATTAPSHAALLASRHPRTLGLIKNGHVLFDEELTLPEYLAEYGYRRWAFISSVPIRKKFGFGQGFEHFDERFDQHTVSIGREKNPHPHDRRGDATVKALRGWIRANPTDKPLFVWLHLVDPHAPYRAPEKLQANWPEKTRGLIRRYDAEVYFADRQVREAVRALQTQRPGRDRMTVITSDHGEGLGNHDWIGHGVHLYEEAVRVPLVMHWPRKIPYGTEISEPVTLQDIAPTIVKLLELPVPENFHGRDLFGPLEKEPTVVMQRRQYKSKKVRGRKVSGGMFAVLKGRSKYMVAPKEERQELFDLISDPAELTNLAGHRPDAVAKMETLLSGWKDAHPEPVRVQPDPDEEDIEALRALGYVD